MPITANHAPENVPFELTLPEDRTSLQRALNELLSLIASNRIDDRRATLLFRVLSLASRNLTSLARNPDPVSKPQPAVVAEDQPEASPATEPIAAPEETPQINASAVEPAIRSQTILLPPTGPSYREKMMQRRAHLQQQAALYPVMSQRPPATLST